MPYFRDKNCDLETVKSKLGSLELEGVNNNEANKYKENTLFHAAREGYSSTVEYLVLKEANVNVIDERGDTPLVYALVYGQVETAKTLVRLGAKIDHVDKLGRDLMDAAMYFYKVESIQFVLDLNIYPDKYGKLLLRSAEEGDLELFKSLVESNRVKIDYVNIDGHGAIHFAALKGQLAIIEYLVLKEVAVDAIDNFIGDTPLFIATRFGQIEAAKMLIQFGARTDVVNEHWGNLLDTAIYNFDSLRYIIDLGFDIHQDDESGCTLLMKTICRYMIRGEIFSKFHHEEHNHWNGPMRLCPFPSVAGYGYQDNEPIDLDFWLYDEYDDSDLVPLIRLLLELVEMSKGETGMLEYVDYNGAPNGNTALHLACYAKKYGTAKLLLHCGANPDIKNEYGYLPYDYLRDYDPESYSVSMRIRSLFDELQ